MPTARAAAFLPLIAALALSGAAPARPADPGQEGLFRMPTLHDRTIVFASEGDLWIAALPDDLGATIPAHRLTAGQGIESHPVLSPDGASVAYAAQYEGNTDVYVMPIAGGTPTRLTFHPDVDVPMSWTPDGGQVIFRSPRAHPTGKTEAWRVYLGGGMPQPLGFGECAQADLSSTGSRIVFAPWSNETWNWRGYRGGTAPDLWIGDLQAETFLRLTDDPANDLFPMWLAGRAWFLSDRSGRFEFWSVDGQGGDLKRHADFSGETYEVRWPSPDRQRRASRIVFCRGAALSLFDVQSSTTTPLDVRIATDRPAARPRFESALEHLDELALSPDGSHVALVARGEVLVGDVGTGIVRTASRTPAARERGIGWLDEERVLLLTDAPGEEQVAVLPADGSDRPSLVTEDREAWLFPPVASPRGAWIAFADQEMRLHAVDMSVIVPRVIDRAEHGEITDYRFSPDGNWIAYVKPGPTGLGEVWLHALTTSRSFPVSDGRTNDREPRWDPAGRYLYFLTDAHVDGLPGVLDFEVIFANATCLAVVPLASATPPPDPAAARAAGFDLEAWAAGEEEAQVVAVGDAAEAEVLPIQVDVEGLAGRRTLVAAVRPGTWERLEAVPGGVLLLRREPTTLMADDAEWLEGGVGGGSGVLHRVDLVTGESEPVAQGADDYVLSADGSTIAWPVEEGIAIKPSDAPLEAEHDVLELAETRVAVAPRDEWAQMLREAWRLQRDFYWAPTMKGIDWPAMYERYAALLPRVGTREELDLLVGAMLGELGTSHAYVFGGDAHARDEAEAVSVGMLGVDLGYRGPTMVVERILPGADWNPMLRSPLAAAHLGVQPGQALLAVNGVPLAFGTNIHALLQGAAGEPTILEIADDERGANRRKIEVVPLPSERLLRYHDWVERNRARVEEASEGRIGYLHVPDMGGEGLAMFARQFYHQHRRPALLVDVRDNGGGFVSQLLIERLSRPVRAWMQPRNGAMERYPMRGVHAHQLCLIDQFAGSDGDIFPAMFRLAGLGPLVGTRTWGGVVGIRGDKATSDRGITTQPEFAWWEREGWTIENHGVAPDVEVRLTPADRAARRDPQLERGIEMLLEALGRDAKQPPPVPAYPGS